MSWALRLTVWWMNFATRLATWMLLCGRVGCKDDSLLPTDRVLNKSGCIVRTSQVATPSLWPPLVLPLTSTGKRSTTWLLLHRTNAMLGSLGLNGAVSGEDLRMWFILSYQEPARGPQLQEKTS